MQSIRRIRIQTDKWFPVYIAVLLMIIPVKLLLCIGLSIFVHELFHLIAIIMMGLPVYGITIGVFGARIISSPMDNKRELICSLAGPVGGVLLALFCYREPLAFICSIFHTIYNLLPIYPLDGGRIFLCIMSFIFPVNTGKKISIAMSYITKIGLIMCIGVYLFQKGVLYFLPCLIVAVIKIPCKLTSEGVQ